LISNKKDNIKGDSWSLSSSHISLVSSPQGRGFDFSSGKIFSEISSVTGIEHNKLKGILDTKLKDTYDRS